MGGFTDPDQAAWQQFGALRHHGLAYAWPALVPLVQRIFAERVAKLPWVPGSWLAGIQALQAANPTDLVRIAPARNGNGQPSANNPLFLDDAEKLDAWQAIWADMQGAVNAYAAARATEGRAKIDALYANAAFWDACYKIAVFTRDAPGKAASLVADGLSDVVASTFKQMTGRTILVWCLIAVGVALGLWAWLAPASFLKVTKLGSLAKLAKG